MTYLSQHLPNDVFLENFDKLRKLNKTNIKVENNPVQFRSSSDIVLEKKPCPCMANKVKQTPSS